VKNIRINKAVLIELSSKLYLIITLAYILIKRRLIMKVDFGFIKNVMNNYPKTFKWIQDKANWEHIVLGKVVNEYRGYIEELIKEEKEVINMKTIVIKQECNSCGKEFDVKYFTDSHYEYVSEPCDCEDGFSPISGQPSISQWLEQID